MKSALKFLTAATGVFICASLGAAFAGGIPAAKACVKIAQHQVEPAARANLVLIEGRDSDSNLQPRRWDITFYDPHRLNGGVVVRVKDAAVTSVSTSIRMLDDGSWSRFERNFTGYKAEEVIPSARWKLDSDQAIAKVVGLSRLANIQVTETRVSLRKLSDGDVPPVWRVSVRGRHRNNPSNERWLGSVQINAETGETLADDLRLDRLKR
jgi:hypothetical protein